MLPVDLARATAQLCSDGDVDIVDVILDVVLDKPILCVIFQIEDVKKTDTGGM